MKRIFTIVCIVCIALGLYAASALVVDKGCILVDERIIPIKDLSLVEQRNTRMELEEASVRQSPVVANREVIEVEAGSFTHQQVGFIGHEDEGLYWLIDIFSKDGKYRFMFAYQVEKYDFYTELTESDFDMNTTYGVDLSTNKYIDFKTVTLKVSGSTKEGTTVESTYVSTNGVTYHITAFEEGLPSGTKQIEIKADNMSRGVLMNSVEYTQNTVIMADDGDYNVEVIFGASESGTYSLPASAVVQVTDKHTNKLLDGTVQNGSLTLNLEAMPATLTGTILYSDGTEVLLTISGSYLDGDMQRSEAIMRQYTSDKVDVTIEAYPQDGYVDFILSTDKGGGKGEKVYLSFNVGGEKIPAGTYPFGYGYLLNTVDANPGLIYMLLDSEVVGSSVMPSFFANTVWNEDKQEELLSELWMLVDGEVKVAYDQNEMMRITIDAMNSYDIPIKITYSEVATSMEQPEEEEVVDKMIGEDGQLYILRNGRIYSAIGAMVR